ncbi:MAG: hypothetical protein Q8P92_02995 [Candidatus Daviesbacteria bacterium]|nr:hypothetical protein [Candidatus Daviesbacteria bacterium]
MSVAIGLFDSFDNLDQIESAQIARWLALPPSEFYLKNYLANKILYPQTVPISASDIKIDLAILREALRINSQTASQKESPMLGENPFINLTLRKILIPKRFLKFMPDLITLSWAFIDGLLLERKREDFFSDIWTVVLTSDIDEVVGSIILPQFSDKGGLVKITLLGNEYQVKAGSLTVIPCPSQKCQLDFRFIQGKILDKEDIAIEVYGGKLGLMIDGRRT